MNLNGGCGICGDPLDMPKPRKHEAGGFYGNGIITRTYNTGQDFDIEIEVTAHHKGYFTFKLCPQNNIKQDPEQQLPKNVRCDHCIIQVTCLHI